MEQALLEHSSSLADSLAWVAGSSFDQSYNQHQLGK
jgi:hypothetical protein